VPRRRLAEAQGAVARDVIATLLWPESPSETGRARLELRRGEIEIGLGVRPRGQRGEAKDDPSDPRGRLDTSRSSENRRPVPTISCQSTASMNSAEVIGLENIG